MVELMLPGAIKKADIKALVEVRGQLNDAPLTIGLATYAPGTLVFVRFTGSHRDDGLFHGNYEFRPFQPRDAERDFMDITVLPGVQEAEQQKTCGKKATEKVAVTEIHNGD